jgi:hypothetical protein
MGVVTRMIGQVTNCKHKNDKFEAGMTLPVEVRLIRSSEEVE